MKKLIEKMKKGEPVTILAIGDSITWAKHYVGEKGPEENLRDITPSYTQILQNQLRTKFNNQKIHIKVVGLGGYAAQDALPIFRDVIGSDNFDLVIIQFGHNDRDHGFSVDEYISAIKEMIEMSKQRGAEVILLTSNLVRDEEIDRKSLPFVEALRKLDKEERVGLVDIYANFVDAVKKGKPKESFFYSKKEVGWDDSIHINEEGHRLMAVAIKKYLLKKNEA